MLLDGELDAAVVGDKLPDPRLKQLIPDADVVGAPWAESARRRADQPHGGRAQGAVQSRPDVVQEVTGCCARASVPPARRRRNAADPLRFGVEA